jgi:peptide/nickel transport system substrate-binding protein
LARRTNALLHEPPDNGEARSPGPAKSFTVEEMSMRPPSLIVALVCAGAFVAGCGGSSGGSSNGSPGSSPAAGTQQPKGALVDGATFTYAIPADPGALDPATNLLSAASRLFAFAYDTVVVTDAHNKLVPNLAATWTAGPKQVRLTLRKGVTCADGSAVTASVVAKNLEHLQDPKVQNPVLGTLDYKVSADDADGVVTIRFGQPVAFPAYALARVPIVCGKAVEDRKALERGTSGSGPYELTEAVPNDHYTFTLRKGYRWAPGNAPLDAHGLPAKVVVRVVSNETTVANLLLGHQLQAGEVNGVEVQRLQKAGLPSLPGTEDVKMMLMNEAPGRPAADPAVRKALITAIDRNDLGSVVRGRAATGLVPPSVDPCADPATVQAIPGHDGSAADVLEQAGWTKGSGGVRAKDGTPLRLTVLGQTTAPPTVKAAGELVVKAWRDLGVDVRVTNGSDSALQQKVVQGAWDAIPLFGATFSNPSGFVPVVSGPAPPKGANFGHVDNPSYTKLAGEAIQTADQTAACKLWNQAQAALYSRADIVPMVQVPYLYWRAANVGFQVNSTGPIPTTIRMHGG